MDRIDINTASMEILTESLGLSEQVSRRVIRMRKGSPFVDAEDLMEVDGIGASTAGRLSELVSFSAVGVPGERLGGDPMLFVGAAILQLADSLHGRLPPLSVPVSIASDAIPVQCKGQYDAVVSADGEETERDFPGGDGPAAVRSEAARKAKEEAKENVLAELDKLEARIVCESGCSVKAVGSPVVTFGPVSFDKDDFGYFVSWDATVTATAKQTFKCV